MRSGTSGMPVGMLTLIGIGLFVFLISLFLHNRSFADEAQISQGARPLFLASVLSRFSHGVYQELAGMILLEKEHHGNVILLEESRARERYRLELSVDGETVLSAFIGRRQAVRVDDSRRYAVAMMNRLKQRQKNVLQDVDIESADSAQKDLVVEELVQGTEQDEKK